MKKKYMISAILVSVMLLTAGCRQGHEVSITESDTDRADISEDMQTQTEDGSSTVTEASLPETLAQIPESYTEPSDEPGTLVELTYDTYESMSYDAHDQVLHKRAIVYLPYGYSEDEQYYVFYLMHGGWSNETTYLGTPEQPNVFKNILDNGMADGKIRKMIVITIMNWSMI